jgi:hypothetical protein
MKLSLPKLRIPNKRMLLIIIVFGIAAALIGTGVLYAYFSVTVESKLTVFEAGTINMSVDGSFDWTEDYNGTFEHLKPCMRRWVNVTLQNTGTNPMYVWLKVCNTTSGGGEFTSPDAVEDPTNQYNRIEDVIQFDLMNDTTVMIDEEYGYVINSSPTSPTSPENNNWATKSVGCRWIPLNLTTANVGPQYVWESGDSKNINMSFMMACNTTNWAQGDMMNFTMTFFGVQSEGWENSEKGDPNLELGLNQLTVVQ